MIEQGQAEEVEVEAAPLEEMNAQLLQVRIPEGSRMHGVYINQLRLPRESTVSLVLRNGASVLISGNLRLQSGDQLLVVAPEKVLRATERRLHAVGRGGALANWFGEDGRPRSDT